jgi:hypothetical protein
MDDDHLEEPLGTAARDYHAPPPTPREAMWQAIEARRRAERPGTPAARRWIPWAAAATVLLAAGAALGRLSAPGTPPGHARAPAAADAGLGRPRVNQTAYRIATIEHLDQSEAFLTMVRASLRSGHRERLAPAAARQLLATNRLLLDSPAARDSRMRLLLQDLELVLAEVAQLPADATVSQRELMGEGIERGAVLPRLRTVVPAGTSSTRGDL